LHAAAVCFCFAYSFLSREGLISSPVISSDISLDTADIDYLHDAIAIAE